MGGNEASENPSYPKDPSASAHARALVLRCRRGPGGAKPTRPARGRAAAWGPDAHTVPLVRQSHVHGPEQVAAVWAVVAP